MPRLVVATTHRGASEPRRDAVRDRCDDDLADSDVGVVGSVQRVGDHVRAEVVAVLNGLHEVPEEDACGPAVTVEEGLPSGRNLAGVVTKDGIDAGLSRADPLATVDADGAGVGGCCTSHECCLRWPLDGARVKGRGRGVQVLTGTRSQINGHPSFFPTEARRTGF